MLRPDKLPFRERCYTSSQHRFRKRTETEPDCPVECRFTEAGHVLVPTARAPTVNVVTFIVQHPSRDGPLRSVSTTAAGRRRL